MLRRHYGVSGREYASGLPAWEADLLLDAVEAEQQQESPRVSSPKPSRDPWEGPPRDLMEKLGDLS